VGEVGVGDVGQLAVARAGEDVLELVDRDGGAGVVGVELDDLAAVARAAESTLARLTYKQRTAQDSSRQLGSRFPMVDDGLGWVGKPAGSSPLIDS
jgi:hypothetical protein